MDFEFIPLITMLAGAIAAIGGGLVGRRSGRKQISNEAAFASKVAGILEEHSDLSPAQIELVRKAIFDESSERAMRKNEQLLVFLMAIAGAVGALIALAHFLDLTVSLFGFLDFSAFAQTATTPDAISDPDIKWLMPWIVAGIMLVMAIAFVGSIITLLVSEDSPKNQSKLKAATDIVKTFGGFFTGIATSLLH